jgi:transcriptional regulator with XRE-family HTH domain
MKTKKTKAKQAFGNRVRENRKAKGISQEKLADLAGMHRTYIGAIERGEQNVSVDNINRLAKALKVKPSSLFDGS